MSSRELKHLHPDMKIGVNLALSAWKKYLYKYESIIITCTFRSLQEQEEEYQKGRTKLGPKTTNAKPGQSYHNYMENNIPMSLAIDVCPLRNGKLIWGTSGNGIDNDPNDNHTDDLELWQRVGLIGKMVGLEWAGDWKSFKEYPHFQHPFGKLDSNKYVQGITKKRWS